LEVFAVMKTIAWFVVCLLCAAPVAAQTADDIKATISRCLKEQFEQKRFRYGAVVLAQGDRIILAEGYGGATPDKTIFRIASVSKLFVATAAMQLVEQGKLDLRADINRYLHGFQVPPTTMEQLLTHTGGLEERFEGLLVNDPKDLLQLGEYFKRATLQRIAPPGEEFAYSNHGAALAGHVIEAISGERFEDYAQRHILEPLAMTHSTFHQPPPPQGLPGDSQQNKNILFQPYPAASLMSTAEEMGHFLLAHLNQGKYGEQSILRPATLSLMHQTHWTAHPQAQGVACGFFESWANGRHALFHTGDSGHHGILWLLPAAQVGLYFVCAADDGIAFEVREKLIQTLLDKHFPITTQEPTFAISSVLNPSGLYESASVNPYGFAKLRGLMSQVRIEQTSLNELRVQPTGLPAMTVVAVADRLYRTSDGAMLAFSADGRVGTYTGSVADPKSFHRISRWRDARLHIVLIGLGALTLLSGMIVGWKCTWRRFLLPGTLLLLAPLTAVSTFLLWRPPFVRLPLTARLAMCQVFVGALSGVCLLTEARRRKGWAKGYVWLVGGAGGLLLALLAYWHITPWRERWRRLSPIFDSRW